MPSSGISIGVPLLGVALAYGLFLGRQLSIEGFAASGFRPDSLERFWFRAGWIDSLYDALFTTPYTAARALVEK
jgi:hypothetical protein